MEIKEGDNLFDTLPVEILETIFVFCGDDAKHIGRIERISKKCNQFAWRCQPALDLQSYHNKIDDVVLKCILNKTKYGKLKYLNLNSCSQIDGDKFPSLDSVSLEHLNLAFCNTIHKKLFIDSWNMPHLLSLDLHGTFVTSGDLLAMKKLTHLTSLNVFDCADVSTLKIVSYLTQIKSLDCGYCDSMRTMTGFRDITNLHNLEELSAQFYFYDNAFGLVAEHLTRLTYLDVSQSNSIAKNGIEKLTSLTGLKHLNISWCDRITNEAIGMLTSLTNLENLGIAFCRLIDDNGLQSIGILSKLTRLDLSGNTSLTDNGAAFLNSLTNLKQVSIDFCSNITPAGLVDYRKPLKKSGSMLRISTEMDID